MFSQHLSRSRSWLQRVIRIRSKDSFRMDLYQLTSLEGLNESVSVSDSVKFVHPKDSFF